MSAGSDEATLRHAIELHRSGRLGDAARMYDEVIGADPGNCHALNMRGVLAQQMGQIGIAEELMRRALAVNPAFADAHYNLGLAMQMQGRLEDAVAAYRETLRLSADSADALHNLGRCLYELGRLEEAIECQRRAIGINPHDPSVYDSLGVALHVAGKLDEAMAAYDRAIAIDPEHAPAHGNRALTLLAKGRVEEALSAFKKAAELRYDHGKSNPWVKKVPWHQIHHDAEQIRYLRARKLLPVQYERYARALCELDEGLTGTPQEPPSVECGGGANEDLGPLFNSFVYRSEGARALSGTLNPDLDVESIEESYLESRPKLVVVDEFLSAEALAGLRAYCLESTIWKRSYANGYVSATLGHGFESALLLQISEELRTRFPRVFHEHHLEQAWAFKYDSRMHGVNLHADFAAVNVNFWITPDAANRDPDSGGLIIWDISSPKNWGFRDYNSSPQKIKEYLTARGARPVKVTYGGNRAIIFDSSLFHETDRIDFEEGYENRRINVTLLYGKGLRTS